MSNPLEAAMDKLKEHAEELKTVDWEKDGRFLRAKLSLSSEEHQKVLIAKAQAVVEAERTEAAIGRAVFAFVDTAFSLVKGSSA